MQLLAEEAAAGVAKLREYVLRLRGKASTVLAVEGLLFGVTLVHAQASPTFTLAMTSLATDNPCAVAAQPSYRAAHCVNNGREWGPELLCDDGGFAEYSSAFDACVAARDFFPVTTKVYASFGLQLAVIVVVLYPLFIAVAERELPVALKIAVGFAVEATSWACADPDPISADLRRSPPICPWPPLPRRCAALNVGVLLQEENSADWPRIPILALVHDLDLFVINVLAIACSGGVAIVAMRVRSLVRARAPSLRRPVAACGSDASDARHRCTATTSTCWTSTARRARSRARWAPSCAASRANRRPPRGRAATAHLASPRRPTTW